MFHLFKLESKGEWKSVCGKKYTVVCVDSDEKHPLSKGWHKSLDSAIAAKSAAKSGENKDPSQE